MSEKAKAADSSLEQIVLDLVDRVSLLETQRAEGVTEGRLWALEVLRRPSNDEHGRVVFAGVVDTPAGKHFEWQEERPVAELLALDWAETATSLAALGHPVRLVLLRALYEGMHTVKELQSLHDLGTTGQLYHHLRDLQSSGWVRQEQRNWYAIPPDRIVPLLTIFAAVGGQ